MHPIAFKVTFFRGVKRTQCKNGSECVVALAIMESPNCRSHIQAAMQGKKPFTKGYKFDFLLTGGEISGNRTRPIHGQLVGVTILPVSIFISLSHTYHHTYIYTDIWTHKAKTQANILLSENISPFFQNTNIAL